MEASKLFEFTSVGDAKQRLQERMATLRKVNETVDGYKLRLPKDDKADFNSPKEIMYVRQKVLFLIKSYMFALEKMKGEQNGQSVVTWQPQIST